MDQSEVACHEILQGEIMIKADAAPVVTVNKSGLCAPAAMIDALLQCPYAAGGGALHGADCWGIVELWYRHVLGIALDDRAAHPPGHDGLQAGFDAAAHWRAVDAPENHCLVILRAGHLRAGHVGVFFGGRVLHSSEHQGCVYQALSDRWIRSRVTRFLRFGGGCVVPVIERVGPRNKSGDDGAGVGDDG